MLARLWETTAPYLPNGGSPVSEPRKPGFLFETTPNGERLS